MAYISKITPLGSSESYDIRAAALGSASVGATDRPIYLNSGIATQCYMPESGNYFRGVPRVNSDGVMEIGKYIDFHNSNTGTTDYDVRLTATTQLTSSATIEATGLLKTTNNSNTTTIGSQNASFCHIYNSANIPFIFNNNVLTTTGNLGNATYPFNNLYLGKTGDKGIYYVGTKATNRMIRFIDNTSDAYGNGISIGGGGQTIIGGGESADTAAAQAGTAGAEIMQVCNDGDVQIISNLQNGWDSRKVLTLNTSGYLMCPSYINVPTNNNENPTLSQFIVTNGSDHYYRKASAAHAMAAIRSNASGSWGISITGSAASLTTARTLWGQSFNGTANVNGSMYITASTGSWSEGIRIKPYGSWSTVLLGGNDLTADSGTSANSWSIHNNNGTFCIARNGSNTSATAYLTCVSNKWSVSGNITSPSTASSWINGQNSTNAAYNVGNATNTDSYWPWLRQTNTSSAKWFSFGTLNTSFYWIGSATSRTTNGYDYGMQFNVANGYLQGCSRVYGAVWNDYAEYRITKNTIEPGRCVIETGNDDLVLSTKRLQPGAEIVSDTFGFAIGETDEAKTPIASNGRVLAYIYEGREAALAAIGKPVCSGPNGTVSIMTDEEYQKYGYCAIGTISAVPDYEEWGTGKVKVNNRIWIRIR